MVPRLVESESSDFASAELVADQFNNRLDRVQLGMWEKNGPEARSEESCWMSESVRVGSAVDLDSVTKLELASVLEEEVEEEVIRLSVSLDDSDSLELVEELDSESEEDVLLLLLLVAVEVDSDSEDVLVDSEVDSCSVVRVCSWS